MLMSSGAVSGTVSGNLVMALNKRKYDETAKVFESNMNYMHKQQPRMNATYEEDSEDE